MIDPKLLRNNIEAVNQALAKRGVQLDPAEWASLEARRKEFQSKTESLQAERNSGAKQVGQIKKAGGDASEIMARMHTIGDEIKAAEVALAELQAEIEDKALSIPNLPDDSVPEGKDENDNVEISKWGTPRQFDFEIKDHTDLGEWMGGLEFETATKLTGSRFSVLKEYFSSVTTCFNAIHARYSYLKKWLYRSVCTVFGQCRFITWYRSTAKV